MYELNAEHSGLKLSMICLISNKFYLFKIWSPSSNTLITCDRFVEDKMKKALKVKSSSKNGFSRFYKVETIDQVDMNKLTTFYIFFNPNFYLEIGSLYFTVQFSTFIDS